MKIQNEVVRVGTANNFNCTLSEWDHLNNFAIQFPNRYFFINSNIHTPALLTTINHPYKIVITVNPDLKPPSLDYVTSRLNAIRSRVAFIRVKYLPDNKKISDFLNALAETGYPIVITMQRFNSRASLLKYSKEEFYTHSHNRFRLSGKALKELQTIVTSLKSSGHPVWICDLKNQGCPECGLCAKLTTGHPRTKRVIKQVNLSSSGICPYNCPDCYAKTMQRFSVGCNHRPILFDKIYKNKKQAGKTAHIKAAKEKSNVIR